MGKLFEIRLFFIAAVVYVMAANGFPGSDNRQILLNQKDQIAARELHVSVDFPDLMDFALNEGNYITVSGGPVCNSLKHFQSFKAVIHASEVQVVHTLAAIVSEVVNFPFRIRKCNLLFPFHYFF